jgi:hypothetical protein
VNLNNLRGLIQNYMSKNNCEGHSYEYLLAKKKNTKIFSYVPTVSYWFSIVKIDANQNSKVFFVIPFSVIRLYMFLQFIPWKTNLYLELVYFTKNLKTKTEKHEWDRPRTIARGAPWHGGHSYCFAGVHPSPNRTLFHDNDTNMLNICASLNILMIVTRFFLSNHGWYLFFIYIPITFLLPPPNTKH